MIPIAVNINGTTKRGGGKAVIRSPLPVLRFPFPVYVRERFDMVRVSIGDYREDTAKQNGEWAKGNAKKHLSLRPVSRQAGTLRPQAKLASRIA